MRVFVVAINQKEANELAPYIGWDTRTDAEIRLRMMKAPPTDPFYANQYRIYPVEIKGENAK